MTTYTAPQNKGLLLVIEDLERDRDFWMDRLRQAETLKGVSKDKKAPIYREIELLCTEMETKTMLLNLLIHRYKGWLV